MCLESVIIKNAEFITYSDGKVEVNPNISVKLTGFGYAAKFNDGEKDNKYFKWDKDASHTRSIEYSCPEILNSVRYDGEKADNWSLGMMLIHAVIGRLLYDHTLWLEQGNEDIYWSMTNGAALEYLKQNRMTKHFNKKVFSLLHGLLDPNESRRFNSMQILKHQWFEAYFKKYKKNIKKRKMSRRKKSSKRGIYVL